MVSIGTNTSINFIIQTFIWFLLFLFIPKKTDRIKKFFKILICYSLYIYASIFLLKIDFMKKQIFYIIMKFNLIILSYYQYFYFLVLTIFIWDTLNSRINNINQLFSICFSCYWNIFWNEFKFLSNNFLSVFGVKCISKNKIKFPI